MMEEKIFHLPAVAAELKNWVEARLHTDGTHHLEEILKLQDELSGSKANPVYVLVDPATGERLGRFEGATRDPDKFIAFLRSARPK
ncbi:MAG: hypothetical protein U1E76_03355 [Planctomycetota bacterium]